MILEIAEFKIKPEMEAEFVSSAAKGIDVFRSAKGCRGVELRGSEEAPGQYRLLVRWDTVENHLVDFRGSEGFQKWRGLIAHCFAETPIIHNWSLAVPGFGFWS